MRGTTTLLAVASTLVMLGSLNSGCGTGRFVQRGIDRYNVSDYTGAAAAFDEIETERYDLNPKGRIRFLAYRGLTYYKLGRMDLAQRFLGEADVAYRSGDPAWLHPHIVTKMTEALAQLRSQSVPASPPAEPKAAPAPTPAPAGDSIQ